MTTAAHNPAVSQGNLHPSFQGIWTIGATCYVAHAHIHEKAASNIYVTKLETALQLPVEPYH